MSNRHRRTRIYGANYNIGESYYKKQLDDLDNKRGCNRERKSSFDSDYNLKDDKNVPKVTFFPTDPDDYDDEFSTRFARKNPVLRSTESEQKNKDIFDDLVQASIKTSYVKERTPLELDYDKKVALNSSFRSKFEMSSSLKDSSEDLEASRRVKATKARLLDLEQEMVNLTDKQNEREKRNQNLKKILSSSSNNENFE